MKIGSTILLKLVDMERVLDKFIIRQFCLMDTRENLSKIIYQYEYLLPICNNDEYESEQCIPTVFTHNLLDFIVHLNQRSYRNNQQRYITVHCG